MTRKILVVDDEPLILKTIERALVKVGYEVRTTPTMDSFLEALASMEPGPDVLIMDLNLGRVTSSHMMDKIREMSPRSKVLLISGSFPERIEDQDFLEKPFRIDELRQKIREMLDEP